MSIKLVGLKNKTHNTTNNYYKGARNEHKTTLR